MASARRATSPSGARQPSPSTPAASACSRGPRAAGSACACAARTAGGGARSASGRGLCGVGVRDGEGSWHLRRLERRCGPAAVGARDAPVLPLADSGGATYVAWTHATRQANSVTIARVGRDGPVSRSVVSRQRGAMLDDVAAGPDRAIAVTWAAVLSKDNPLLTATYAGLRRTGGTFAVERLSPPSAIVARGSRVAFHPLTGQAVVAIPYVVGRTLAVGSAISPRATP